MQVIWSLPSRVLHVNAGRTSISLLMSPSLLFANVTERKFLPALQQEVRDKVSLCILITSIFFFTEFLIRLALISSFSQTNA